MTTCTHCGGTIEGGDLFCTTCGQRVARLIDMLPSQTPQAADDPETAPTPSFISGAVLDEASGGRANEATLPVVPWKRLASWGIDLALALAAVGLTSAASGGLGLLVLVVGVPGYYVGLVGRVGSGTLGHRALRLRVCDARSSLPIGEARAALRLAVVVLAMVPMLLGAIASTVRMVRQPDRRAWHDLATETVVVGRT